jgi:hypothetical protein
MDLLRFLNIGGVNNGGVSINGGVNTLDNDNITLGQLYYDTKNDSKITCFAGN